MNGEGWELGSSRVTALPRGDTAMDRRRTTAGRVTLVAASATLLAMGLGFPSPEPSSYPRWLMESKVGVAFGFRRVHESSK